MQMSIRPFAPYEILSQYLESRLVVTVLTDVILIMLTDASHNGEDAFISTHFTI